MNTESNCKLGLTTEKNINIQCKFRRLEMVGSVFQLYLTNDHLFLRRISPKSGIFMNVFLENPAFKSYPIIKFYFMSVYYVQGI